jgi:hypothetical protein
MGAANSYFGIGSGYHIDRNAMTMFVVTGLDQILLTAQPDFFLLAEMLMLLGYMGVYFVSREILPSNLATPCCSQASTNQMTSMFWSKKTPWFIFQQLKE